MSKGIIRLTKMDTRKILLNPAYIQTIEETPDTVIILEGGRKLLVKESMEEVFRIINE